jgi:hypothetical protein
LGRIANLQFHPPCNLQAPPIFFHVHPIPPLSWDQRSLLSYPLTTVEGKGHPFWQPFPIISLMPIKRTKIICYKNFKSPIEFEILLFLSFFFFLCLDIAVVHMLPVWIYKINFPHILQNVCKMSLCMSLFAYPCEQNNFFPHVLHVP